MQILRVVAGEMSLRGSHEKFHVIGGGFGDGDVNRVGQATAPLAFRISFTNRESMDTFCSKLAESPVSILRAYFDALWPGKFEKFGTRYIEKIPFPYTMSSPDKKFSYVMKKLDG